MATIEETKAMLKAAEAVVKVLTPFSKSAQAQVISLAQAEIAARKEKATIEDTRLETTP